MDTVVDLSQMGCFFGLPLHESNQLVSAEAIVKRTIIGYWIATVFAVVVMTISGVLAVGHMPGFMDRIARFGYPPYFANLLGVGKLTGVVVLLAPRSGRLKEWAYAAFGIVVISACYTHYESGDGLLRALEPMVTGIALAISYALRPASRRFTVAVPSEVRVSG
ncbi:MAG: hypothetical protein QOE55_1915 [Acidobacteriaceae bacterium]|nr:hypothetical protein [Acidobacteriaceae bacterium]MDX6458218.1 hypothetical protein [Acidobacteriaceae bacterium]